MFDNQDFVAAIRAQVAAALHEDMGSGDITAALLNNHDVNARVVCRDRAVVCGTAWFDEVFRQIDDTIAVSWKKSDGDEVDAGTTLCSLSGPGPAILSGERTALNFLQTLSGTASTTRLFADALKGSSTQLLDTRKTIPGLRLAQKYAVKCGGGTNHRVGLFDAFLIKENHIAAAGGIAEACARARKMYQEKLLEVEVETFDELQQAIDANVDRIMLDNFSLEETTQAVRIANGRIPLESSGDININSIARIAATGVDYISIGAITKHVQAINLSLQVLD
ncbi:MAG: carboxylating nicotinate-nucleotide diphosphorylase [Pseudomonadota bacterium]